MRPILPVLGILSALWLFGGTWWLSNLVCGAGASPTFSVTDGDFSTNSQDLFSFQFAGFVPGSKSDDIDRTLKDVVGHMKKNPDRILTLSGVFATKEDYKGDFQNLGIARAESIKSILVNFGADPEQINTSGERIDNLSFIDKKLYGGVNFIFDGKPVPVETISEEVESDLSSESSTGGMNSLILMFEPSQADYDATSDLTNEEYISGLKAYLASHPGSRVVVTGHTDDAGSEDRMQTLSLERASKIRRILRNAGLKSRQVVAQGAGYSEPAVSHDDIDAAVKNNRVVVSIEK